MATSAPLVSAEEGAPLAPSKAERDATGATSGGRSAGGGGGGGGAAAGLGSIEKGLGFTHSSARASVASSHEPTEHNYASLDFLLCVGAFNFRDEDIFGNLLSKDVDDVPYAAYLPDATWTCRVGEAASQAKHYVDDEGAVANLLSTLCTLSQQLPPPDQSVVGSVYGDDGLAGQADADLVASALDHLERIEALTGGKQLAFFLDYDGTLTPIVENPSAAILSRRRARSSAALAARYPTAIVSGARARRRRARAAR